MEFYRTKSNVKVTSSLPDSVTRILDKYFTRDIISMGAITRKLPFFLMDLVISTKRDWNVRIEFNTKENKFETYISSANGFCIIISNGIEQGTNKSNSFNALNKLFQKDKWIRTDVTYGKVLFNTNKGDFIYEKTKYACDTKPIYTFSVSDHSKLWKRVTQFFGSDHEPMLIKGFDILKTSTAPFSY